MPFVGGWYLQILEDHGTVKEAMMKSRWALTLALAVMMSGSLGCYYDQWQAAERANRVLQEENTNLKDELQACQLQNSQKDTMISSLRGELGSKDQTISSLSGSVDNLRGSLRRAEDLVADSAARGPGEVVIVRPQKLPEPLHNKLQELAESHPGVIEYDAAKGVVRWKADLLFPSGSADIVGATESVDALQEFASIANSSSASGFDVIVVGHTDNVPVQKPETLAKHKDNWHLSAHRAISVMKLMANRGVPMEKMGIMGYGEYRPIATNATPQGKAKNRRVEIYLVSKDSIMTAN
jgi:chemotaxis protein MotB